MNVLPGSGQRSVAEPMEVTDDNFHQAVIEADFSVLLYVWCSGCESCQIVGPAVIRLASREVDHFRLVLADRSEILCAAEKYAINTSPMLIFFRNGQELARRSGVMIEPEIARWLSRDCL